MRGWRRLGSATLSVLRKICLTLPDTSEGLTSDPRYRIPPYTGHMGWIALDVSKSRSERELRSLALGSYRHFALKKMLAKL